MSDPALDTKASLTSDADQTADVQPVVASPVKSIRNGINRVFSILVLAGLFTVMSVFAVLVAPGPLKESRNIIIPRGANVHEIAGILDGNKAIYHPLLFRLGSKLIAYDTLHAGEYQIDAKDSIANIVLMLHAGRSIVHRVTVAEGLTSAEVVKLLNDASALNGDITSIPPEGSLLPETYLYTYGDSRVTLIEHMQKAMRDMVNGLWTTRDPSIPITNSPRINLSFSRSSVDTSISFATI